VPRALPCCYADARAAATRRLSMYARTRRVAAPTVRMKNCLMHVFACFACAPHVPRRIKFAASASGAPRAEQRAAQQRGVADAAADVVAAVQQ